MKGLVESRTTSTEATTLLDMYLNISFQGGKYGRGKGGKSVGLAKGDAFKLQISLLPISYVTLAIIALFPPYVFA